MWRWRVLFVMTMLAGAGACTQLSGVGDLNVAMDVDPNEPEMKLPERIAPRCSSPSRCLVAPAGWEGPFVVATGAECPSGFDRRWERLGAGDAAAPPAQCTCSCGAIGGSCSMQLVGYTGLACNGPAINAVLEQSGACVPVAQAGIDSFRAVATPLPGATCPVVESTSVERIDAGVTTVGCAPSAPAPCGEGLCFPPSEGSRLCVRSREGDAPSCPASYPERVAISEGLEDTRGCSACTCSAQPACVYSYMLFGLPGCINATAVRADNACMTKGGVESAKLTSLSIAGGCTPNGGRPIGGVQAKATEHLCCEPR